MNSNGTSSRKRNSALFPKIVQSIYLLSCIELCIIKIFLSLFPPVVSEVYLRTIQTLLITLVLLLC